MSNIAQCFQGPDNGLESDLHVGCRPTGLWWQVLSDFNDSIRDQFRQPIDMILVTGDLTFSAPPEQFALFDDFLSTLLCWLRDCGQKNDPLIIPVPGNHDVCRPADTQLRQYRFLDNFWMNPDHADIAIFRRELWQDHTRPLAPLFSTYSAWLQRRILSQFNGQTARVHTSHFPADLSVFIDLPDRPPITVVGLNSSWIQYKGSFEKRIELFTEQLHYALGRWVLSSFHTVRIC